MRWPWQRKRPGWEAVAALEAAERDWPKVREVADLARELAARNGFGEAISKAMGGRS